MTLSGEEYILLLSRSADLQGHHVSFCSSTEEALSKWNWTSRSSPVFATNGAKKPDLETQEEAELCFLGPIDPSQIEISAPTFLSLGAYNVVVVATNAEQKACLLQFLKARPELRWEKWRLKSGHFGSAEISQNIPRLHENGLMPIAPSALKDTALVSADNENRMLLAASFAKASIYLDDVAKELATFTQRFRELISDNGNETSEKQPWLVTVNAHLSRYSSQTFSGVSPIIGTESHFWTHSLLGVGVATQALVRIRRFIESSIDDIDWMDKLQSLQKVTYSQYLRVDKNRSPLYSRHVNNISEWRDIEDFICTQYENIEQSEREKRLPLLVCFSGRDGFRSTQFSLSAPLEVISGCNTYGWSPMTLTHEISHVWVAGILSTIFPDLDRESERESLGKLFNNERTPDTLFEELQLAMYFCADMLYRDFHGIAMHDKIERTWFEIFEGIQAPLNEILTHVMDYQYFFYRNDEKYMQSIWLSWDTIPNIKHRLNEYILRSASALLSGQINHDAPIQSTLDRLEKLLDDLCSKHSNGRYTREALSLLRNNRLVYEKSLTKRARLIRLFRTFITDDRLAARLQKEKGEKGGPYTSLKAKSITPDSISNPLRFMLQFANDKNPDSVKSAWMLTKIAFASK